MEENEEGMEEGIAETLGIRLGDRLRYDLAGTPCEETMQGGATVYEDHVGAHFPKDFMLEEMGTKAYVGLPLFNGAQTVGIVVATFRRPIEIADDLLSVFNHYRRRLTGENRSSKPPARFSFFWPVPAPATPGPPTDINFNFSNLPRANFQNSNYVLFLSPEHCVRSFIMRIDSNSQDKTYSNLSSSLRVFEQYLFNTLKLPKKL